MEFLGRSCQDHPGVDLAVVPLSIDADMGDCLRVPGHVRQEPIVTQLGNSQMRLDLIHPEHAMHRRVIGILVLVRGREGVEEKLPSQPEQAHGIGAVLGDPILLWSRLDELDFGFGRVFSR